MNGQGFRRLRVGVAAAGTVLASLLGAVTRPARGATNLPVMFTSSTRWRVQSNDCAASLSVPGNDCGLGVAQFSVNNAVTTGTGFPSIPTVGAPTLPTGTPPTSSSSSSSTTSGGSGWPSSPPTSGPPSSPPTSSPPDPPPTNTSPAPINDGFDGLGLIGAGLERGARDIPPNATLAFNRSLGLAVDNQVFRAPGGVVDLGKDTLSAGPQLLDGLLVSVQYRFSGAGHTVRAVYSFSNPTGHWINTRVTTNIGGLGGGATLHSTSSGDALVSAADRWLQTDGNSAASGNTAGPAVLFVADGEYPQYSRDGQMENLAPVLRRFSTTPFAPHGSGFLAGYDIAVAPGATVGLMTFAKANTSAASALQVDATFGSLQTLHAAGLLNEMPIAVTALLNWNGPSDIPPYPVPPFRNIPRWPGG